MSIALSLMLAFSVFGAEDSKSGTLLQTLPPDGAWVKSQVSVTTHEKDISLTWNLRSVGSVVHNGEMCHHLELEQVPDGGSQQIFNYVLSNTTWRLVIPEKEFGEAKDPLASATKIRLQQVEGVPEMVASLDTQDPILAGIVRGPVSNVKVEVDQETIGWQRGELTCGVISGRRNFEFAGIKFEMDSRILRNHDIPFSVGGLRQELKAIFNAMEYKVGIKATLVDHGSDAKPKLSHLVP